MFNALLLYFESWVATAIKVLLSETVLLNLKISDPIDA